jgi:ATP phosphoribosyltransferase regulatory subunit
LQFGAELFGHAGPSSDAEIIQLMLNHVMLSGLNESELLLDVGHVGVFRGLIQCAGLAPDLQEQLFQALRRGSLPEMDELLQLAGSASDIQQHFRDLAGMAGDSAVVLSRARSAFDGAGESVMQALDNLHSVIEAVHAVHPDLKVHLDLAELRGYRYHTGIVFALYDEGGSELARGGRYDAIGESFGRARPATGFSGDLIKLALAWRSMEQSLAPAACGIWVESAADGDLWNNEQWKMICRLRKSGERVVTALSGSSMSPSDCRCDRMLVQQDGMWVVRDFSS